MIAIVKPDELSTRRSTEEGTPRQERAVREILAAVRAEGDDALKRYTRELDGTELMSFEVAEEEVEEAYTRVSDSFVHALRRAAERIRHFHEGQRRQSWMETGSDGTVLGQLIRPLSRVGIYVPGGRAAYPSSVLMNAIPATVAGVEDVVMVTPPRPDGSIHASTLVAAREAGVHRIFKVGGAQAVGALAFGTPSVPRVDKIVGPGNIYVALAKRLVYGQVDIDMVAGPSEIVVVADRSADPVHVAADLLSQAEHDPMASSVLITPSADLAKEVAAELEKQCERLPRKEIAEESLREHGAICLTQDLGEAVETANRLAPEHLELMVEDPWRWTGRVKNAGALFLGPCSPEPVGDYFAGPNHVLPTNGTARFFSPLGVDDFIKKTSLISYSREALFRDADAVITLAEAEGLAAHAESIRVRLRKGEKNE
ncbi:histidinol dehydrogenase [Melghirimyces profundicolus]|uniref:Histidinol dehydrogenase n=1 Tax=Melghirimyces profundicolus TaxID=1242148 RepID=A0A2T6BUA2_9BACL|nr:histidinol dehydrogenase [Melghirimyces profundicolus]PTX59634.1 histidinol dehydrogenase [Melghirimyces profundicolus]